ncbi:MAG: glycosyltransferase [Caldilineaceae bacterium]
MIRQATVVIPTYNRAASLQRVLAALACQSLPDSGFGFEVVVVSDGSQDGTIATLATLETPFSLRCIEQEHAGPSAARNRGIAAATGELILFLDDDVAPHADWITAHLQAHAQATAPVAVIGPMWSPPAARLQPWVAWEQAQLHAKYARMRAGHLQPNPHQFYTGNASVLRTQLLAAGGFDTTIRRMEDVELAYRLAAQEVGFVFAPQAYGYHYAHRSYGAWLAIPYTYGQNSVWWAKEKGRADLLATVLRSYAHLHPLQQRMLRLALDRPAMSKGLLLTLQTIALLAHQCRLTDLANRAFSGIYNLRRYQGMADALGGRASFLAAVAASGIDGSAQYNCA